ncbi:two-component system histidine kinase PnpS [Planomicrobium sp. CPCC 101079]|uniref:two-component system histidine kinase PnpS n=1 Tax=Planomicrobium sp. CPCC 101079 TaxID=2599618 RepID=UPI0011B5B64C|nr:ATP-binding protein [Planomicrobium sp. CPCC 101079]TWT08936.1 PAS domain-containing protein [Planomicrobium sp. CPCC 101079]
MKSFRHRLLVMIIGWIGLLLAGLLIIVSQLFPLYTNLENPSTIWLLLFLIFAIAMAISTVISHRIIKIQAQPIENVTETALELVKGNYRARAVESGTVGAVQLSSTINVLARNLQEITAVRQMEQERLKTLIENMGSSLMMINRQGRVSLVNTPFLKELDMTTESVQGKLYKELSIPAVLAQFIENVFMTETPDRDQIDFFIGLHQKHLDVYGAPIMGEHERWLGVVIVAHDISDLKRLEQVRKDFVANVSHELRTPVTSIKGFSETLLDGAYEDTPTLLSFLEIIQKESNRLELLIKDLLELSKIEHAGFQVNSQPTDMKAVIERAAGMIQPRMEEKSIRLQLELEPVKVFGDPNRLIQVMMNLLANALTYSASKTTVEVRLYKEQEEAVIQVKDQGIGIEASEIGRLFERFYRVDRARSRNSGGTGLGLSIVKHLVEAHHGKLKVDSEVGVGTTFTVYLPLAG